MKAEPANQNLRRPELPPPGANYRREALYDRARRLRGRAALASHLLAGLAGGVIVGGMGFLALTQSIPGLDFVDSGVRQELVRLEQRTADLDHMLRSQSRPAVTNPLSPSVPSVEAVNELRARLDGMVQASRSLDDKVQSLSARLDAVEQRANPNPDQAPAQSEQVRQIGERLNERIGALSARLTALEQEVTGLNKAQSEKQVDARSAALTLALANLKRAISEGKPFAAELAAVENLSTVKLPILQLTPFKETGIATLADLTRDFGNLSKKAVEKYYQADSGSFIGKVFSRAKAAIQIRPSDSSGDSIEAVIGRMDKALRSGNLKVALSAASGLKGAALDEMRPWLDQAQARVAADEAVKKTDQELLAALIRPASKRQ